MCGGGGHALKPKQYARLSNDVKFKNNRLHKQCRACGTIKISKYMLTSKFSELISPAEVALVCLKFI